MKFLLTTLILSVSLGLQAQAAPLCAGLLNQIMSEQEIDSKIQALARLKLSLDLELTNGNQSIANENLKADFSRTLTELIRALESRYTREELHAKISKEIHKLQNKSKEDATKEKVIRAEAREHLPKYVYKKRIKLPQKVSPHHPFEYIPELKVVTYVEGTNGDLIKYDIANGKETVLYQGDYKAHLLPDRKTLLVVSHSGEVVSIDIASGQPTPFNSLPAGHRRWSLVDNTGEILYSSGDGTLIAYNLKDQTAKTFNDVENNWMASAFGTKVILTGAETPVLFDTATGVSQNIGPKRKLPGKFAFASDDGKQIVLDFEEKGLEFYDADKPKKRVSIAKKENLAEHERFKHYKKMNGVDLIIAKHFDAENLVRGTWEIFSLNNLNQPIFEFLGYESNNGFHYRPESINWTPDRKKAAILVRRQDYRGNNQSDFIDIWELAK